MICLQVCLGKWTAALTRLTIPCSEETAENNGSLFSETNPHVNSSQDGNQDGMVDSMLGGPDKNGDLKCLGDLIRTGTSNVRGT